MLKIYERCLFSQLSKNFDAIFSKLQGGFRKVFNVVELLVAYDIEMKGVHGPK